MWLAGFYAFFHVWLNVLAELLRFGDRVFYLEWWNTTSFEHYWRLWNIPVHSWIARHIYFPFLRAAASRGLRGAIASLSSLPPSTSPYLSLPLPPSPSPSLPTSSSLFRAQEGTQSVR